jgi:uncharacterized delta-60 repeat protein
MLRSWFSRTPKTPPRFAPRVEAMEERMLLNAGGLDPGFGLGGKVSLGIPGGGIDEIKAVTRQNDGKIVVAGYATMPGGDRDFAVARYHANGTLDSTFGLNGSGLITTDFQGGDDRAFGVVVQPDGKIVAAGYATTGFGRVFGVARYTANGQLDVGNFGATGKTVNNLVSGAEAHSVALQADGKIVVAGWREQGGTMDFAVGRFQADGGIDGSFGPASGVVTQDFGNGMDRIHSLVMQNGKILVGGSASISNVSRFTLARYDLNGNLDPSFDNNGLVVLAPVGVVDEIHSLALQTDGKIVAAGRSVSATSADFALLRFNANGSLDDGTVNDGTPFDHFGTAGKVFTDFGGTDAANGVAIAADGKIIVAGETSANGQSLMAVARYNASGSLDGGFGIGGQVYAQVNSANSFANGVAVEPNGNIVAAGYTNSGGGDFAMIRLLGTDPGPGPGNPPGQQPQQPQSQPPPAMSDVTGQVLFQGGKVRRTRRPGRFRQVVSLVNVGNGNLAGPMYLVLDGLRRKVKLRGVEVMTQKRSPLGSPGRVVVPANGVLRPGQRLDVVLEFASPLMGRVRYTPRVLSGTELP